MQAVAVPNTVWLYHGGTVYGTCCIVAPSDSAAGWVQVAAHDGLGALMY